MKVLIIEDHPIVVSGCRALFASDSDVELFDAPSLRAGRECFARHKPDVTVVDINLPDGSGLDLSREIVASDRTAKVVVFSMSDAPVLALRALEFGAKGYVSKTGDPLSLRDAVYSVARGERWLPPSLVQEVALMRVDSNSRMAALTDREVQILRALVRGMSMAEIAEEIDVCYKTVASDCATIRSKFNARTTSEMVRIAAELRIV
ncbi:MAG: response regulator transcription factor [Hyphomicrobium sp.]